MFCSTTIIVATLTITTVIRAQLAPELDDNGTCHDQLNCMGSDVTGIMNYGECCGDPARISFMRDSDTNCFNCSSGVLLSYIVDT